MIRQTTLTLVRSKCKTRELFLKPTDTLHTTETRIIIADASAPRVQLVA